MANDNGGFTTGLLVGGILGTIIGIMIAPKSGSQTRSQLLDRSESFRDRAESISSAVVESVSPTVDHISEKLAPTVDKVIGTVTPIVDQVNAKISESRSRINSDNKEAAPTNQAPDSQ